jgi:hypothetical protein
VRVGVTRAGAEYTFRLAEEDVRRPNSSDDDKYDHYDHDLGAADKGSRPGGAEGGQGVGGSLRKAGENHGGDSCKVRWGILGKLRITSQFFCCSDSTFYSRLIMT